MDSRSAPAIRVRRSPLSLSISLAALGLLASLSSADVLAACTPGVPTDGFTLTCAGTDQQNFASAASNLTVNVIGSAVVSSDGSGDPVLQLTGSNNIVVNSGQIYPSYSGQQSLPTTGLKVGNSSTQNITISNNPTGSISGTGANPGASIVDLKGMALDVEAGAGGKVTIVNHGTIFTNVIVGGALEVANMPTVAVYGGAQVEMFNTNTVYGRIAFQASAEGNTFTNSGSLGGSLSMGAGGGNNRFNAITGSGVQASGVSGASSVTVASNPNLVFLAPGIVDGGAGGSNTLALQNAIGGGSGSGGSGTIFAANFLNFSNLLVQSGSWTVSGALLTGATTSTRLSGGALWVNNSGAFGTGIVNANGATLSSFATSTLILANDINLEVNALSGINGLTVSGSNNITLSGVISGDGTSPLTKTGTGVLRLDGTNTYSGGTALNAGSLVIGSSQALGTGAVSAATGTRIDSGATATLSNTINLTGTVNFGGTGNLTLSGALQGNASSVLNKDGAGTLVLSNANTYGGGTTLGGGTLLVGNNASLGGGALTVSGASSLGATQSVMLNNAVALNSNLTVSGDFALRLNGNITGGAANKLIKTGSGNLTLTGTSNFQGGVELNGGTLTVATNSGALGSGAVTATGDSRLEYTSPQVSSTPIFINNGVTLEFANVVQIINMGSIGGSATSTLAKTGSGELMLFNANAFSGLLDVREGTVTAAVANALGTNPNVLVGSGATVALTASNTINSLSGAGQVTVIAGSTFTVGAGNASSTFSGALSGLGALTKSGTGTLTLSGISGLSGNTTVSAGRLNIASSGSLASNLVTVANGATLGGSGTLTGGVTINSGGHLAVTSGSTLNTGTLTLASGSNLDIGLGTPTIATPMINVTGNVAINSSTFNFSDAGGLANGTYRLINYTGTLNYGGANPGIFPADVVLGQITLSMDNVAKTANIVVNSPALAIQYWDGTSLAGNGAVEGGSGVWNATNTNWTKSSGAINDVWRGVSAIFQNGSGTVVIQDTQTISALQFKSDGYVLYADVADGLNLVNGTGGSALVTVDSGITGTLDTPLSGTGKLQKSGAGTLVLTRSNRYSGGTTLSAGTLLVRDDAALGSAALSLASGTTLQTDRFEQRLANNLVFSGVSNINVDAGSLTLSGGVSGAGGLIKIGTGSLTLSGNNTQLGNTWLNAGGLVLGSNTALGAGALITAHNTTLDSSLSGALIGNDVAISGDLTFLGTRDLSLDGTLSGLGNLIKNGASTLSLMKASSLNGSVTLNQGTLRLGDNNALGASLNNLNVTGVSTLQALSSLSIANFIDLDAQLTISGPNDLAISGWIGGNGGLIKDGSGTLTLSGVNSYQGGTELKSGTLKLSSTLGGGVLDVTGVASLEATQALLLSNPMNVGGSLTLLGNYETSFFHGLISGAGTITKTGTADLRIDANSRFSGTYNIDGGRIYAGVNSLGNPTLVNIASGAMLELGFSGEIGELNGAGGVLLHGGNLTVASGNFSGELSGNGSLSKTGSGILLLSGASSLRATTFVDAGTLRVDGSLGGTVIVSSDAVLTGRGSLAGNVTIANGGHLSLAGGSVLTLGSLVLNDTSNLDVALGAVTPGAAGLANVTGNLTLDGRLNIANTGGFGIGVYRLFDYGGALTNNGLDFGTLPSGVPLNELALQTNVANQINLVVGGAADIRFWDGSQLTGNSVVDGGDGTWNSTNSNWTTTNAGFNEAWNSTFAVFQGAAGTVTVDGTQSVTGLQFINNYTLAGGSAGQLQLVSGISGDTAVRVDSGKTAILDVNLTGNGILNKLDSGTLVLNGSNSHTDGTRLSGGTLVLGNNDALGSGSLTTSAGTTLDTNTALSLINDLHLTGALTLGGSHDLVLNGLVLGNGTLVKNGSGTLTLNQANDYAGTALNAGTLLLGNSAALGAGQLTVAGPASLDTSAAMTLGNAIDFGVNTGSRLTLAGNHDLTLSGVLSGNGTLIKQGVGTVDLTGNNDFSGSYRIDNGRLNLLGSTTTGTPAIDISTAGTLGVGASSAVGLLSGQGAIALENNSVLTVAGGNYAGAISGTGGLNKVDAGSLILTGVSSISGTTTVSQGVLSVTGQGVLGTSGLTVANGATLAGTGRIDGAVTLADGGHVQLASSTTLTTGNLTLNNDSNLDAFLGAAVAGQAGMLKVNGNLVLDGKLNVTDAGGFGLGVYRLIDYTGSLTDNGLAIGTIPGGLVAGDLEVQTSVNNQVNLLVGGAAGSVLFWDGSGGGTGAISGGNGTWGGTGSNWTNASGNFNQNWNDGFAVFQGNTGTVTVEGTQTTTGLQFLTDGYTLVAGTAGELNLINGSTGYAGVRVGSGNSATVDVNLTGSATLNKLEAGTLVLNGSNSYSGGTQLNGGTLVVGNNAALGSGTLTTADLTTLDSNRAVTLGNAVTLNGGLILAGSNDLSLTGTLGGSGALAKNGNANLTLSGNNSYSGGTLLNAGSLTLGHNAALGTGALTVLGNTRLDTTADLQVGNAIAVAQQLTLDGSHDLTLSGVLSGNGALIKNGNGQLLLTGTSTYTGNTAVNAGGLTVNGSFASANVQVASGASLGGSGSIAGQVSLADGANLNIASATAPLTVGGLSLASTSNLNFALGAPGSGTTLVQSNGNLTLDGLLNISNAGGFGIGVYQLFSYGGSLTDNGLTLGTLPTDFLASQMTVQTEIANQVNLVVGEADGGLLFWNGSKTTADGTVSGGSGTWGADTNWTNSTGKNANDWSGGQFAVFGGQGGTVTIDGQRTFSGIQFLSNGYQLVGTAGSLEAVNAADGSLASLRVAGNTSALIAAQLVGSGGIEKLDGGTLVLSGANTYSGGTLVSGGTLIGNTTSLQGDIVDNADLIFQQDVNGTFSGNLSGTGSAYKRGAGTLLFTGDHSFSGDFLIQEGVLQVGETVAAAAAPVAAFARMALFAAPVGNTLAADIVVANGAGLTGTGTVNSVINKGTVQPGPNGNLTVTGDFTNASEGTLSINLTPLPTSYLAVGGTANLAGTLNVFAAQPYTGDTTYTLLTAGGGITGKFDSDNLSSLGVASNLAFIDTRLVYGSNDVSLSVARNGVAFADVAVSDNQRDVATALGSAAAPASLKSAITSMDRASAQAAFDSLSGEIHASTASVLLEDSRYLRNTVNDRMRQGDCGNGDPRSVLAPTSGQQSSSGCQGQGVGWITALGGWSNNDGSHGAASVDRDLSGFMLGFDNNLNDEWRAGIAAGYTKTSLDASKRNSDASVDSYHLATYLSYQLDAFAARMGAGYSWHDIDSKRHVAAGSYNEELKAKYKAGTAQVFGEVGYTVEAGGVALEPFAGIAYVNYDSDTGREKGGAGALEASSKQDATFTTVGLRAGKQFTLGNGTTLTPRGSLGWRHAFGDTTPDADLRFVDGGAAFSSQGVPIAKDAAVVEAGLDVSVGAAGKLGVGYSGQLSSDNRDHAVTVSFSMGF